MAADDPNAPDTPHFTWREIPFRIHTVDSPTLSVSKENYRLTVKYWLDDPTQVHDAIAALVGYTLLVVVKEKIDGNVGYFQRITPHTPTWDTKLSGEIHCIGANQVGFLGPRLKDNPTDGPKFEKVLITATYERLPYKVLEDAQITHLVPSGIADPLPWEGDNQRYMKIRPRDISKYDDFPAGSYVYKDLPLTDGSNGTPRKRPVQYGIAIQNVTTELTVIWYGVIREFAPAARARSYLGKVNSAAMLGCSPGTLKLQTMDDSEEGVNADLQDSVNLKYVFQHKPTGWNFFPDLTKGVQLFEIERRDDPTKGPYALVDLRELFWPNIPNG